MLALISVVGSSDVMVSTLIQAVGASSNVPTRKRKRIKRKGRKREVVRKLDFTLHPMLDSLTLINFCLLLVPTTRKSKEVVLLEALRLFKNDSKRLD